MTPVQMSGQRWRPYRYRYGGIPLTAIGNKLYSVGGFLYGTRQFAWELPPADVTETWFGQYNNTRRVDPTKTYPLDASNAATNAVYVYIPPLPGQDGSGVWTAGPPLNQGRAFHTCTAVGNELHVIGGEAENFTGGVTAWTGIPTPMQSLAGPMINRDQRPNKRTRQTASPAPTSTRTCRAPPRGINSGISWPRPCPQ